MLSVVREGFARDLLVTLVVTALLGAAVAGGVARAVDTYLGRQVTGVLGDLGEYDLILHVREDARELARSEIAKVLASSFKGARMKEGPTVIGKANFFIALPDERRTRSGLEGLARALGDVPGASGETYIIEPRLSVGGVEPGAFQFLMNEVEKLPGVRFCFRDGGTIAVVLGSVADLGRVSDALKDLLDRYKVVEVRFPIGLEMDDSVAAGDAFARALASLAGASFSRDITRHGTSSDLADLTATLTEMKRFLQHYAARVAISIDGDAPLRPGDVVFLEAPSARSGAAKPAQAAARKPGSANVEAASPPGVPATHGVLVQVKEITGNKAWGIVIEGDTDSLGFMTGAASGRAGGRDASPRGVSAGGHGGAVANGAGRSATGAVEKSIAADPRVYQTPPVAAFLVDDSDRPQKKIGTAQVTSESKRLGYMVDESIRLLRELEVFRDDAYQASLSALDILGMYDTTVGRLVDVQRALERASEALGNSGGTLGWQEAAAVEKALRDAISVVDSLGSALDRMDSFESQAKQVLSILSSTGSLFEEEAAASGDLSPALRDKVAALRSALDLAGVRAVERAKAIDKFVRQMNPVATQLARWKATLSGLTGRVSGVRALLATGRAGVVVSDMLDATNTVLAQIQSMDVIGMQEAVREVSRDLGAVRDIDTGSIIRELEYIKASLPNLRDDEVGRSIRLIDRYIGGEVIPGDSLQILVDSGVDRAGARMAAEKRFGPDVRVYVSPAGVVEPGVRSQVYRVLHEARATVAALLSFVFSLLVLALDHAAIVSAVREFQRGKAPRRRARIIDAGSAYAMVVGAAILVPVFIMSGAKVPYLGTGHVAVLGAAIGYLISTQSERISPASGEEITAGMAMGLTHTDIMREIVVPSSRPGILSLLNRRKVRFRGTAD